MKNSSETLTANETSTAESRDGFLRTYEIAGLIALASLIVVINVYILFVFLRYNNKTSFSNMLFLSLIVSDLIVGAFALPVDIIDMIDRGVYIQNVAFNLVGYVVANSQSSISVYILFVLTIHRVNLIKRPLKANEKLTKPKLVVLVAVWLLIYSTWTGYILLDYLTGHYDASAAEFYSDDPWQSFGLTTLCYIVPAFIMIPLTALLVLALRKKIKRTSVSPVLVLSGAKGSNTQQHNCSTRFSNDDNVSNIDQPVKANGNLYANKRLKQMREIRAIVCLLAICFTVFFSQIFYIVMTTLDDFGHLVDGVLLRLSTWVTYFNSLSDPLILLIFHDAIRKGSSQFLDETKSRLVSFRRAFCSKTSQIASNPSHPTKLTEM